MMFDPLSIQADVESVKYLKGINLDTSVRFTSEELAQLDLNMGNDFPQNVKCIIGSCLGGALQKGEPQGTGLLDKTIAFFHLQSDALTAQTYCSTDMTFEEAMSYVEKKSPALAAFLIAKRDTVKQATQTHYDKQETQDKSKVIEAEVGAAKSVAKAAEDTLSIAPAAVAVGVVVGLAVLAVVLGRKAS